MIFSDPEPSGMPSGLTFHCSLLLMTCIALKPMVRSPSLFANELNWTKGTLEFLCTNALEGINPLRPGQETPGIRVERGPELSGIKTS